MAAPPRMLLLDAGPGGGEAFVTLPTTYDKAIAAAIDKFNIPRDTHIVRLTCNAAEMPYIGGYAGTSEIFITDNDSYHYACAGKHVARLNLRVFDRNPAAITSLPAGGNPKAGIQGGKPGASAADTSGPSAKTVQVTIDCKKSDGKQAVIMGSFSGDATKGPPAGEYLGTLSIAPNSLNQKFVGQQLGPNEVFTKFVVHDKHTARLLFRPRSVRPQVDILYPEEKSLEVSLSVADWQVVAAYPMTSLIPDNGRQKLRWFIRVRPGGIVEDLLTGTEASGLFVELLPAVKARPEVPPGPEDPLVPAWPDVRPQNAWCLPQSIFVPHIDRVLTMLGLPVESRTAMITSWLPGISRHKNIAYRLLTPEQLAPTTTLHIIPAPQVLLRVFILFKGIQDGEMKDWQDRGVVHAEMGLDWRNA
ncbi:hypothetical protein DB88DRAFT_479560 [Papiliotrema laurentii]|uniref:Uncharacterized protein n=1 Tax=Papiliotrema laurentii TaxID=5418 RepID=A0AAD9FX09_PAPLA|nr:hypothetical protein DB88DRAFT_479560 [Papiliotrema laurentii]